MVNYRIIKARSTIIATLALASCGTTTIQPSPHHLQQTAPIVVKRTIPNIVQEDYFLPKPLARINNPVFNVVVSKMPVQEVLFTLASDAKINLDIHPEVQGVITLNAVQQPLLQILERIKKQSPIRYEWQHNNLTVLPDKPYLKNYPIDYVNVVRETETLLQNNQQVTNPTANNMNNHSAVALRNQSKNHFWDTLVQNIKEILRESDEKLPQGNSETIVQQQRATKGAQPLNEPNKKQVSNASLKDTSTLIDFNQDDTIITRHMTSREVSSVIANAETGVLAIRATEKQHEKVQAFIQQVLQSARRQVMIEMTIVEVRLSEEYHQGVNWASFFSANNERFQVLQQGNTLLGNGMLGIISSNNIARQISLLSSFGNIKVLSSPKLSVLNNQTAMMRVVDNLVYFTVKADTVSNANSEPITTYTTTPNTIPVGFTMSLTPQISQYDEVLLNIKPSISRLIQYIPDPNPNLLNIRYLGVPEIQTREMESLMRLANNQIAVMGGLMQDRTTTQNDGVPGLSKVPVAGEVFKQRNEANETSELVIFIKPVVIKSASLSGDYEPLSPLLPNQSFFQNGATHEAL